MTYDAALHREATSGIVDTRQWGSYGTVSPETPNAPSVTFTKAYGPLVNVKLHPSGIPVVCRVTHEIAGNGEGEWYPFVAGDEVWVQIPEGDERAGCCITGRLNQEIDAWPEQVAGQDATKNNFGFRRMRAPYIIDTAAAYLIHQATTGAFLSMTEVGAFVLSTADKSFLGLNADFLGMQNADADLLLQLNLAAKQVVLQSGKTTLTVDAELSSLYTPGTVQIGTAGQKATGHATTVEAVANMLAALLSALGALSAGGGALGAASLATALALLTTPSAAQAAVAAVLATAAGLPSSPAVVAALTSALASPSQPGLGAAGLLIG